MVTFKLGRIIDKELTNPYLPLGYINKNIQVLKIFFSSDFVKDLNESVKFLYGLSKWFQKLDQWATASFFSFKIQTSENSPEV